MARVIRKDPLKRAYVSLASSRFGAVYRTGTRCERDGVLVIRSPGETGPPQVGIVAGRGVGNAVRRNRAKRRLRAAAGLVDLQPGMTYVVVATPGVVDMPFHVLVNRLAAAIDGTEESKR